MKVHVTRILLLLLAGCFALNAQAQTHSVTGRILSDEDGKPLAAVSIQVKGKSSATQTASDGSFTIAAESSDLLIISHTGFSTVELPVKDSRNIELLLK